MAKIRIISVGDFKESYLKDAFAEYKKRLGAYAELEEITLPEERIRNEENDAEIRSALEREGERIIASMPRDSYRIALCVEGRELDSEALAKEISRALDGTGKISFVIGSSHGLAESVKRDCHLRLSFSKMTFPHQLMKVILAEAVYRSFTIIAGKRYHK